MCSENNNIAFGCLLLRPCDGAWTEIGNKIGSVAGPLELETTMV
jgi:hypothetical protein